MSIQMRSFLLAVCILFQGWRTHALSIAIVSPTNEALIVPGAQYTIQISVSNSAMLRSVDFYVNTNLVGTATNIPFSWTVTNTVPGRYRIVAHALDQSFSFANSQPVFVKVGDPPIRLSSGPYLQSLSSTSVVVRWQTDWPVESVVRYGTNAAALDRALTNSTALADREIKVTGLTPETKHFYAIGTTTNVFASGTDFYWRTSGNVARSVRIWAIGDFGTADQNASAVRESYFDDIGTNHTDAWLMLGDNSYNDWLPNRYDHDIFSVYPSLLRHAAAWPAVGNHDLNDDANGDPGPYLDAFTLPMQGEAGGVPSGTELYYSFDYANIHFVALDSFVSSRAPDSPMLTWLRNDLANTEKDWIIAYWHHPPYSFSDHHSDLEGFGIEMRQYAVPILEEYGVDLVLCGHNHDYERSLLIDGHYGYSWELSPSMVLDSGFGRTDEDGSYRKPAGGMGTHNGAVYAVCGCSGQGGAADDTVPRHPVMALTRGGFGSMVITINGLQLHARFLRSTGFDGDHFTIDKSQNATNSPVMEAVRYGSNAVVSWPTSKPLMTLQTTSVVPTNNWQTVNTPAKTNGRRHVVTLPTTDAKQFFRLQVPP